MNSLSQLCLEYTIFKRVRDEFGFIAVVSSTLISREVRINFIVTGSGTQYFQER